MFVLQFWLWLHSLPLPPWLDWVLQTADRVLEVFIRVVSWFIAKIFGGRGDDRATHKGAAATASAVPPPPVKR